MATFIQRGQAIGNALVNGVATPQQLDRLGRALANNAARRSEYDSADSSGKARIYVECFREFCINSLKLSESADASAEASEQAAALVDAAFSQSP